MTLESLMNRFTQYISWLYFEREWARWELETIAITALVLLLFVLIQKRKARAGRTIVKQIEKRASTIGLKLDAGIGSYQGSKGNTNSRRIVSISKNAGSRKRWKETTKQWKSFQKLIEQLQYEIVKYKQAEEFLEQQFIRLKAANEQLRHEITGNGQVVQEPELSNPRTIGSLAKQQDRILNPSGVLAEDS